MEPDIIEAGAGSGGGDTTTEHSHSFDGTHSLSANCVELIARPPLPPAVPDPSVITLLATGMGTDGRVDVRGSQGVRITAGPPPMPPTTSSSVNGAEIIVGEMQNVTIQRGLIPDVDQQILMQPGSILVDGGVGTVTIQSLTEVKIQVMGGLSSITLTPMGIILQGPLIQIN